MLSDDKDHQGQFYKELVKLFVAKNFANEYVGMQGKPELTTSYRYFELLKLQGIVKQL